LNPNKHSRSVIYDNGKDAGRTGILKVVPFRWQKSQYSQRNRWHAGDEIVSGLHSIYADIIRQPLPEHLKELVSSLIQNQSKGHKQL